MHLGFPDLEPIIVNAYKHRNVFVVGGCGFVGMQLVLLLKAAGAQVSVIDDMSRGSTLFPGVWYVQRDAGSYNNIGDIADLFKDADMVFNLAATVAGVLHNQSHHAEMYASNIRVLTAPVLAAKLAGVPAFLQTSSVCVYAPEYNNPSVEIHGMHGRPHPANAGYAEAKRDGERVAKWSGIERTIIVRPSNIAGPGDYFDDKAHVIPALVKRAFARENPFLLYGDASATREFIHPLDVAAGMMYALALGEPGEAYNIGCSRYNTITMGNLARDINSRIGRNVTLHVDNSKGGGDQDRWADASKLRKLGWRHYFRLSEIIDQTIDDYKTRFLEHDL